MTLATPPLLYESLPPISLSPVTEITGAGQETNTH